MQNKLKAIILLLFISTIVVSCDSREPGVYKSTDQEPHDVQTFEYNGIRYIKFRSLPNGNREFGYTIDYSQFFNKDTVEVAGIIWVKTVAKDKKILPSIKE